jgi:hypothetical protein
MGSIQVVAVFARMTKIIRVTKIYIEYSGMVRKKIGLGDGVGSGIESFTVSEKIRKLVLRAIRQFLKRCEIISRPNLSIYI